MKEHGGTLIRTSVGDRNCGRGHARKRRAARRRAVWPSDFPGVQHDGRRLLAALQILRIMRLRGRPLSELAGQLVLYPQVLKNVHVEHKTPIEECPAITEAVARVEEEMAGRGRVLLRYSGTEPLCRVMVEGEDEGKVREYARTLAALVEKELG